MQAYHNPHDPPCGAWYLGEQDHEHQYTKTTIQLQETQEKLKPAKPLDRPLGLLTQGLELASRGYDTMSTK